MFYTLILQRHGLKCILKTNQNMAIQNVVSAVRPSSLRHSLQSDTEIMLASLKKCFKWAMLSVLDVADALGRICVIPTLSNSQKRGVTNTDNTKTKDKSKGGPNKNIDSNIKCKKQPLLSFIGRCKAKSLGHEGAYWKKSTAEEKTLRYYSTTMMVVMTALQIIQDFNLSPANREFHIDKPRIIQLVE